MSLLACEVPGATGSMEGNVALLEKDGHITGAAVLGSGVELKAENGRIIATIIMPLPKNQFHLGIWSGPEGGRWQAASVCRVENQGARPERSYQRWPSEVEPARDYTRPTRADSRAIRGGYHHRTGRQSMEIMDPL